METHWTWNDLLFVLVHAEETFSRKSLFTVCCQIEYLYFVYGTFWAVKKHTKSHKGVDALRAQICGMLLARFVRKIVFFPEILATPKSQKMPKLNKLKPWSSCNLTQVRFVSVKAEHPLPSRHVTTIMWSCDTIMWQGGSAQQGVVVGGGGSMTTTHTWLHKAVLTSSRLAEKIWKVPNHKRDMAKTWCIPQLPSCNMPSGQ